MDMKISGSGQIPGGEYERVTISGSGKCLGNVKCVSLSASGAAHCEGGVFCTEEFRASGSAHVEGAVTAREIRSSGSFHADGNATAESLAHFSGSCHIEGDCISHGELKAFGSFSVGRGIEAEHACIKGVIKCGGLLNADELYMELERRSHVHSIGGSTIEVKIKPASNKTSFCLFGRKHRENCASVVLEVDEAIEGDSICLEGVRAASVIGRNVVIGRGCEIGSVRYSESIEIAEDAVVGSCEKTES